MKNRLLDWFVRASMTVSAWLLGVSLLGMPTAAAAEWPEFRGPAGQGHAEAKNLPTSWSESTNIVWKTPLPGLGWSSPVVDGDQIWLTTAITTPISPEEKERRLANNTGNQPLNVSGHLSMRAVCVDRTTGQLLHDIEVLSEAEPQPVHTMNTFASPTPVIDRGRVFCHFGTHGTACVDTKSGKVLWRNQDLRINHENGPGSSPILWQDLIIFHCDGSDKQFVVALDRQTGKVAWKTDRSGEMRDDPQLKKAYGTPLIVELAGRPQLLSPGSDWLYSYDPDSGAELWKLNYGVLGFSIVPRPVVDDDVVYICTSYMRSELLAVDCTGLATGETPEIAWRFNKQAPKKTSPLIVDGRIYLAGDRGIATCLKAKTGETVWTQRLGGNYSASPLFADGKIYLCNHEGETVVLTPGDTYQEIARNELDGQIMASPIALDQALFVRTDKALYRIEARR